jgi:hypothetical protein
MTLGLSPKAVLAFAFPLIASVVGALASYVVTGNFNAAEIRTAVGGLATSALALLGAYVGNPGVVVKHIGEPGSDSLLPPDVMEKVAGS